MWSKARQKFLNVSFLFNLLWKKYVDFVKESDFSKISTLCHTAVMIMEILKSD